MTKQELLEYCIGSLAYEITETKLDDFLVLSDWHPEGINAENLEDFTWEFLEYLDFLEQEE